LELIFGGKGASRDGLKLTGWYQDGERELRVGAEQKTETFDRKRYGLGAIFHRDPLAGRGRMGQGRRYDLQRHGRWHRPRFRQQLG